MSPQLERISRTIKALLSDYVPNVDDDGITYLLHRIRDDLYVPIEFSRDRDKVLGASEYYLAFSRLSSDDFATPDVKRLSSAIPTLLKQGRVESLCFRGCQDPWFWQEFIPLSANNRLVLVRASCKKFDAVPVIARRFAFPWANLMHCIWEEAGVAFVASQNVGTEDMTSCKQIAEHLARDLADEDALPPFYDLVNFHLEVKAAQDPTPYCLTRCNPLGFTSDVARDFDPGKWPWIPEMVIKHANAKRSYVQHILIDHPPAVAGIKSELYRSILEHTQDLVVKVSEYQAADGRWFFFARHNRMRNAMDCTSIRETHSTLRCSCPFQAVASIIERQPIGEDHLVTLWAVNSQDPARFSQVVGARVEKLRFPKLIPSFDAEKVKENTVSAKLCSPNEFVRITFQPRNCSSKADVDSLRTCLSEMCDATMQRVRLLAPMERLKSIYKNIRNTRNDLDKNVWEALFYGGGKHSATAFRTNANREDWGHLGNTVTSLLNPFSSELNLWECFKSYDARYNDLYLNAAKSFAQNSLSPELCVMLGGGSTVMFPAKGFLSLHTIDGSHAEKQACELTAGLILLSKQNFRLADAELSTNSITGPRMYPLLKLRFESKLPNPKGVSATHSEGDNSEGNTSDGFSLSDIQAFIDLRINNGYSCIAHFRGKAAQRAYPLFMRTSITLSVLMN